MNVPARGDLLIMVKNDKKEVLHFSINTTQVPTCTDTDLTSLYFGRNTVSVAKKCTVPLTQSFAAQLICLNKEHLSFSASLFTSSAHYSPHARLEALHAISQQAIEEERSRRKILIRRSSADETQSILSSVQYRDLLSMNLDIFKSPLPSLDTGEVVPASSPLPVWGADEVVSPSAVSPSAVSPSAVSPRLASPRLGSPRFSLPQTSQSSQTSQTSQSSQTQEQCTPLELGASAMTDPVRTTSYGEASGENAKSSAE